MAHYLLVGFTILLIGSSGCSDNKKSELEYEPFRAFYDISCSEASDMILWDMIREENEMTKEDYKPYIYAYGTRYDECKIDELYVDQYLGLLKVSGLYEQYNTVFDDFKNRFPDQRNRSALPSATPAAPGPPR